MTKMIIDDGSTARPSSHAHKLVRETAVAMAHELYDTMMQDNQWYTTWKSANPDLVERPRQLEARFVAKNLARLLPQARATLAKMLTQTSDAALRDSIYEALCLDSSLLRGRSH